jgi:hypothetical protein
MYASRAAPFTAAQTRQATAHTPSAGHAAGGTIPLPGSCVQPDTKARAHKRRAFARSYLHDGQVLINALDSYNLRGRIPLAQMNAVEPHARTLT